MTRSRADDGVFRRSLGLCGLLMLLMVCPPLAAQPSMANSSRECAICHVRWISALEKSESQQATENSFNKRHAGTSDMCLSCHDGSVADSRFKIWSTHNHTTGTLPPESVQVPTDIFPLDDEGRMTCATCHTAHAVPGSSDIRTAIFLRQPNVDSSLCLACHGEHAQHNEFMHPLGAWEKPIPQVILDAGGKTSPDGHHIICQTCHEPHGARNAWMLVLPPSELCITCHQDKDPTTLEATHSLGHRIGQSYPGFAPPETLLDEKAIFGPQQQLDCLSCHRLHDASGDRPLLIRGNQDSALCLDCHPQSRSLLDSSHDLRHTAPTTLNAAGQTPSQSGPCGVCHRIHGWARELAETPLPHGSGCLECHTKEGPGAAEHGYRAVHPMGMVRAEGQALPEALHATGQTITCLTCHDPHTPHAALPSEKDPDRPDLREGAAFLRVPSSDLCLLCHQDKAAMAGTAHDLRSISAELRPDLPRTALCLNCHQIHGAPGAAQACQYCHQAQQTIQGSPHDFHEGPGLEGLTFTTGGLCVNCHPIHDPPPTSLVTALDSPPGRAIGCQACHRQGGVAQEMSGRHLGKISVLNVNDSVDGLPLGREGDVNCFTCHDIHQGQTADRLLRTARGDPHLCGRCHQRHMALIDTAHDLRRSAPQYRNRRGETAQQAGPCGACHSVHSQSDIQKTPTLVPQSPNEIANERCSSCHNDSDHATAHVPRFLHHPEIALYNRSLQDMPTFNAQGKPSATGTIGCLTCHDPHTARPQTQGVTSSSSFLRAATDARLCRDCHGPETLWRYLYFHRENRNPRTPGEWLTPE